MRIEVPPALQSMMRGSGLAGLAVTAAGIVAAAGVLQPWYVASVELTMLGVAQERVVAEVVGWATLGGVLAGAGGAVSAALGATLAVDRHPGWTRPALVAVAAWLVAAGTWARMRLPTLDRFTDAGGTIGELRDVTDELPSGVELAMTVGPGLGATLALAAGLAILIAASAARDLDRR